MSKARDIADLDFNSPDIDGGNIDGATIGGTTPAAGSFSQVNVDNITIDGNEIDVGSGVFTLDVASDIRLDAGGGNIQLLKGGTEFGRFFESGTNDFYVYNPNSDKDIIIYGNDAGTSFEAARFDMSAAGAATFSSSVRGTQLEAYKTNHGGDVSVAAGQLGNAYLNLASTASLILGATSTSLVNSSKIVSDHTAASGGGTGNHTQGLSFHPVGANSQNFEAMRLNYNEMVVNQNSLDYDFRVESDSNTHALFVNAGNNTINVGGAGPGVSQLNVRSSLAITNSGGAQHILMGNQDSGGTNKPFVMTSANAALYIGNGDSWSSSTGGNRTDIAYFSTDQVIFNDGGNDQDFRVESDSNPNAFVLDAGQSHIGINKPTQSGVTFSINSTATNASTYGFEVCNSTGNSRFLSRSDGYAAFYDGNNGNIIDIGTAGTGVTTFNASGLDRDFRVESTGNANMLFVDGGNNSVNIGTSTNSGYALNVAGSTQVQNNLVVVSTGGANLTQGDIMIKSSTADSPSARGQGVFMFNEGADQTWYAGTGYNAGAHYHIGFAASASASKEGARVTNGVFHLYNNASGAVFNDNGADRDFRVESAGNNNALFVNGGTGAVSVESSLAVMSSVNSQGKINVSGTLNNNIRTYAQHDEIYVYGQLIGSGGVNTKVVTLSFETNHLRALTLEMESSGHKYNNGGDFWHTRHVYTCMSEGSNTRLNSRMSNLEFQNGSNRMTTALNKVSGSNLWQAVITFSGEYQGNFHFRMMGYGAVHAPTSISFTQT